MARRMAIKPLAKNQYVEKETGAEYAPFGTALPDATFTNQANAPRTQLTSDDYRRAGRHFWENKGNYARGAAELGTGLDPNDPFKGVREAYGSWKEYAKTPDKTVRDLAGPIMDTGFAALDLLTMAGAPTGPATKGARAARRAQKIVKAAR